MVQSFVDIRTQPSPSRYSSNQYPPSLLLLQSALVATQPIPLSPVPLGTVILRDTWRRMFCHFVIAKCQTMSLSSVLDLHIDYSSLLNLFQDVDSE